MIALSIAAALAIFLLYTSAFGRGTPSLSPSQLPGHDGRVSVVGKVVGRTSGDGHEQALRFTLRDRDGTATVPVVYRGTVPDLFRRGREVVIEGRIDSEGTLRAIPGTLVTKCPSKYQPAKKT